MSEPGVELVICPVCHCQVHADLHTQQDQKTGKTVVIRTTIKSHSAPPTLRPSEDDGWFVCSGSGVDLD